MIHNILFPKQALELIQLRIKSKALDAIKEEKQQLDMRLKKLQSEKMCFEYFKRILMDKQNVLLAATHNHYGKFSMITTRKSGLGPDFCVYHMPEKWDGDSVPREDCKLWYTVSGDVMTITGIESGTWTQGAGSIAMDMVLEKAKESKIKEIVGDLSKEDLKNHPDRLLGYYKKFGFDVKLYDKNAGIGGEIFKKL